MDLNATLSLLGDSFPLTRVIGKGCCRDSVNRGALRWNAALQPGLGEARAIGISSHASSATREQCASACAATASCEAFEINGQLKASPGGNCYLYGNAGSEIVAMCDTTTGDQMCYAFERENGAGTVPSGKTLELDAARADPSLQGRCDAGQSCGLCLVAVGPSECPSNPNIANCLSVGLGELCEGDGECGTGNGLNNCGGWDVYRKSANGRSDFPIKIKADAECRSSDEWLGWQSTMEKCAAACAAKTGCAYFIYGKASGPQGSKAGRCYWEKVSDSSCSSGWEVDSYDFYGFAVFIKENAECNSNDEKLGDFSTMEQCAAACAAKEGCEYFIYGKASGPQGDKAGRCYWEKVSDSSCSSGWEVDSYDFYGFAVFIKENAECNSNDEKLGDFSTMEQCAAACAAKEGCEYFIYGKASGPQGDKAGRCYWEKVSDSSCSSGWEADSYDFYGFKSGHSYVKTYSGIIAKTPTIRQPDAGGCEEAGKMTLNEKECTALAQSRSFPSGWFPDHEGRSPGESEARWTSCPPNFPHQSQTLTAICYTEASYAAAGSGPCGTWCTKDNNIGSGCGETSQHSCTPYWSTLHPVSGWRAGSWTMLPYGCQWFAYSATSSWNRILFNRYGAGGSVKTNQKNVASHICPNANIPGGWCFQSYSSMICTP